MSDDMQQEVERRVPHVTEPTHFGQSGATDAMPPPNMRATVVDTPESLRIEIPGPKLFSALLFLVLLGFFLLVGLALFVFGLALFSEGIDATGHLLGGCVICAVVPIGLIATYLHYSASATITVSREGLRVIKRNPLRTKTTLIEAPTPEMVDWRTRHVSSRRVQTLRIQGHGKTSITGDYLSSAEVQYLAGLIRKRLRVQAGKHLETRDAP